MRIKTPFVYIFGVHLGKRISAGAQCTVAEYIAFACMYVCMCLCMYVYGMYVCMHVYMYVCIYIYIYICIHMYIFVYIYTHSSVPMFYSSVG